MICNSNQNSSKMETTNMKTFKDLQFKLHSSKTGIISRMMFENGYGVSVVQTPTTYGGADGFYELAVVGKDGQITYETTITSDVEGYLDEIGITKLMEQIQKL